MNPIVRVLRDVDLFRELKPLQLTELARRADRLVYQSGDVLMARDEDCDGALIVVDGDAVCLRGAKDEPIEEPVGAGFVLAEMAMLVEFEATATVVARGRVRAIRINREDFVEMVADDPDLWEAMVTALTTRLRAVHAGLQAIEQRWADANEADAPRTPDDIATTATPVRSMSGELTRQLVDVGGASLAREAVLAH
ncbi:MAG: cyclic nucleotide-binding domain-containing protein [Pseudomonadota bacterium]